MGIIIFITMCNVNLFTHSIQHFGAYLHFLVDFAQATSEDEYVLVTYEVSILNIYILCCGVQGCTHLIWVEIIPLESC